MKKKRKSRLKEYVVTVNFSHESFGGYDHNDGDKNYTVRAVNIQSAEKKALKLADAWGPNPRVRETLNVNDDNDWVFHSIR